MAFWFYLVWLLSGVMSVILGVAVITYIRRTWQLIRAEDDSPTRDRLLDGIDHLETQMHLVAERLGRLDERLEWMERRLEGPERTPLPPGESDEPHAGGPAGSGP